MRISRSVTAVSLGLAVLVALPFVSRVAISAEEAPTGLDGQTNGLLSPSEFGKAREAFEHQVTVQEGLGPVFTARSCAACHGQPITGGGSQVRHLIVGHPHPVFGFEGATAELGIGVPVSLAPLSGFLWPRAICGEAQFRLPETGAVETIRSSRIALNVLGDGFVEAVPDATFFAIAASQPGQSGGTIAGEVGFGPVLEADPIGVNVGRFGWKAAVGSLLTFSAAASVADLGVTNRLLPDEFIPLCDTVDDPEDAPHRPVGKQGIDALANFVRSTKAPARDVALAETPEALTGEIHFTAIGCDVCHVATLQTAPAGTVLNAGTYVVPPALSDKTIHPYSDFLLHDVGTGDGTVVAGTAPTTANKLRTAPLWGVRFRNRIMHDGQSNTLSEAIERHQGEAAGVTAAYDGLSATEKAELIAFLKSL